MKNTYKKIIIGFVVLGVSLGSFMIFVAQVKADAWWGEGARRPEWILQRGGTIIHYRLIGGDKRYKAVMFRSGKYVEVEYGKDATFDDAKSGTYEVVVYKCKDNCEKSQKNNNKEKIRGSDKRVVGTSVAARPGEIVTLTFNVDSKQLVGRSVRYYSGAFTPSTQAKLGRVRPGPVYTGPIIPKPVPINDGDQQKEIVYNTYYTRTFLPGGGAVPKDSVSLLRRARILL